MNGFRSALLSARNSGSSFLIMLSTEISGSALQMSRRISFSVISQIARSAFIELRYLNASWRE